MLGSCQGPRTKHALNEYNSENMTWDLIRNTHQNLTGQCPKVFPCEKLIISQCHSNFISERWKAVFHRVINYEERNFNVNSFQESLIRKGRFMFIKYSLTKKQISQKMSQFIQIIFLQIVEVKSRNLTKVPPGKTNPCYYIILYVYYIWASTC